jgi:hypothetical protein
MTEFRIVVRLFDGSQFRTVDTYPTKHFASDALTALMDGTYVPAMIGPVCAVDQAEWVVRSEMIVAGCILPVPA